MATAVPQTVAADTGSPKYATIQFGTLVVALMVFLLYMGFKLYQQWSEYRSSAHVQKSKNKTIILEMENEGIWTDGKEHRCTIKLASENEEA